MGDLFCQSKVQLKKLKDVHSLKLTVTLPLDMMVSNRNLLDSRDLFSGAMLVSGRAYFLLGKVLVLARSSPASIEIEHVV